MRPKQISKAVAEKVCSYIRSLKFSKELTTLLTSRPGWAIINIQSMLEFFQSTGRPTLNEWRRSERCRLLANKPMDELLITSLFKELSQLIIVSQNTSQLNGETFDVHLKTVRLLLEES